MIQCDKNEQFIITSSNLMVKIMTKIAQIVIRWQKLRF